MHLREPLSGGRQAHLPSARGEQRRRACGGDGGVRRPFGAVGLHDHGGARRHPAQGGRWHHRTLRRVPGGGMRRHRQAARAGQPHRHPARGGELQDLRRLGEERRHRVLRDGDAGRQGGHQLFQARAEGRHRRHQPVEPAALADDLEGRPGAGLRQYGRGEAVGGDADHHRAARRGDERGRGAAGRLQRGARFRSQLGRRVPDHPPGRRRHHLHRRDAHRRGDHEGRRHRRAPGVVRTGWQEPGAGLRRLRPRQGGRGHPALGLRQLRAGLPGHRARLRRASGLRRVRPPPEGRRRGPEARPRRIRRPASARWSARSTAPRCCPTTPGRRWTAPRW